MPCFRRLAIVTVLVLVAAPLASAQTSRQTLNLQGRLTDNTGACLTGPYTFQIDIFNVSSGGASLYTDTQAAVQVTNGIYDITIGAGSGGAIPTAVFSGCPDLWIEITVNTETLTPRTHLTAVAYAYCANLLDGMDSTAFAPATGSANYAPASGSANYVAKTGDTMTGNLAFAGTQTISGSMLTGSVSSALLSGALPALDGSALTGVTGTDATKLPLAGGTMTGNIAFAGTQTIASSMLTGALPALDGSALTGVTGTDATKLPLAGGTMTGNIAFAGAQTIASSMLTGALPALDGSALTGVTGTDATKLPLAGGTMTGALNANGGISTAAGNLSLGSAGGTTANTGAFTNTGAATITGVIYANGGIGTTAGNLTLAPTGGTVAVTGTVSITSTLGVTGSGTVGGTLGVTGLLFANGGVQSNVQSAVSLSPYGVGAGQTGEVRWKELAAGGTDYVAFKASDAIAAPVTWTLPNADGAASSVLTTNGAGVLSWSAAGAGTVTSVGTGNGLTGGPIVGSGTIDLLLNAGGGLSKTLGASVNELGIATGGVTSSMLAAGAVSGGAGGVLSDGTITSADLSAGAVSGGVGGVISDGTIDNNDIAAAAAISISKLSGVAATTHSHAATDVTSASLALARGGTGTDLGATGGAGQVLKQVTPGAAITVGAIASGDLPAGGYDGSYVKLFTTVDQMIDATGAGAVPLKLRASGGGLPFVIRNAADAATIFQVDTGGAVSFGTWQGTAIGAVYGGTGLGACATGDLLMASAANTWSALTAGTAGQVLTANGPGNPLTWTSPPAGFVPGGNSFAGLATLGTNDAFDLAFETNNVERVRVDQTGNVGIGTTTPGSPLTVVGTAGPVAEFNAYGSPPVVKMRHANGTVGAPTALALNDSLGAFSMSGHDGTAMVDPGKASIKGIAAENWAPGTHGTHVVINTTTIGTTATNERVRITDSGNVGIGMNAPTSRLVVKGSGSTNVTSALNVTNGLGSTGLFVDDVGNVGVGMAAPTERLEVNGNTNISGNLVVTGTISQTAGGGDFVKKAGDTMTGALNINAGLSAAGTSGADGFSIDTDSTAADTVNISTDGAGAADTIAIGAFADTITLDTAGAGTTLQISNDGQVDTINLGGPGDDLSIAATLRNANPLIFDGATPDANKTTFTMTDPTAPRTITFPDASGTVALTSQIPANGFVQDGNSFAGIATLGTNDAFDLVFETSNTERMRIDNATGTLILQAGLVAAGQNLSAKIDASNSMAPSPGDWSPGTSRTFQVHDSANNPVAQINEAGDMLLKGGIIQADAAVVLQLRGNGNADIHLDQDNNDANAIFSVLNGIDSAVMAAREDGTINLGYDTVASTINLGIGTGGDTINIGIDASTPDAITIGTADDTLMMPAVIQGGNALVFEGATVNGNRTTLQIADPTAPRAITLPDASGTLALTAGALGRNVSDTSSASVAVGFLYDLANTSGTAAAGIRVLSAVGSGVVGESSSAPTAPPADPIGVYGFSDTLSGFGVWGQAGGAATGTLTGVYGLANGNSASVDAGVHGKASGAGVPTNYGVYAEATGAGATTNYGIYATVSGATTNWAGYFNGNVAITGKLTQTDADGTTDGGGVNNALPTGDVTANGRVGRITIGAGGETATVSVANSSVTANSHVIVILHTGGYLLQRVVPTAGGFDVVFNSTPAASDKFDYFVIN